MNNIRDQVNKRNPQCSKILLREAILLISPFVQIHASVIGAANPTEK